MSRNCFMWGSGTSEMFQVHKVMCILCQKKLHFFCFHEEFWNALLHLLLLIPTDLHNESIWDNWELQMWHIKVSNSSKEIQIIDLSFNIPCLISNTWNTCLFHFKIQQEFEVTRELENLIFPFYLAQAIRIKSWRIVFPLQCLLKGCNGALSTTPGWFMGG